MNTTTFEEVEQISAEMKAIVCRSKQEGRKPSREEQEVLERLTRERDTLIGEKMFHGYV